MNILTAGQVLQRHWDETIPVDPVSIAHKMGIRVQSDPFLTPASGEYDPAPVGSQTPLITFNPCEAPVRQRFTVAHEIGHHALGHGARFRDTNYEFTMSSSDPREVAANRFAAELLMPGNALNAMIHVRGIQSIPELASLFNVSRTAMKYRLENLGYVVR